MMKMNKWTVGLAAAGVVSLASTAQAEENSVLTALSSTVISGNVEASYNGTFSKSNNLYGDQGFVANGASLAIGSPLGEGDYSAGYNVELLLGQRASNFSGEADDFHIKNANIGLNVPFGNGIDLTVGLFDTIVGYEVEASAANPNVDRSYGFDLEPFTHTGVLASTSLSDSISVSLGLANAFDSTAGLHNGTIDGDGNFAYLAVLKSPRPRAWVSLLEARFLWVTWMVRALALITMMKIASFMWAAPWLAPLTESAWVLPTTIANMAMVKPMLIRLLFMPFGMSAMVFHWQVVMTRSMMVVILSPCGVPRSDTPFGRMY